MQREGMYINTEIINIGHSYPRYYAATKNNLFDLYQLTWKDCHNVLLSERN